MFGFRQCLCLDSCGWAFGGLFVQRLERCLCSVKCRLAAGTESISIATDAAFSSSPGQHEQASVLQPLGGGEEGSPKAMDDPLRTKVTHWIGACPAQYATLSLYLAASSATPLPPSSAPNAFRIIVMGCMGLSLIHI